jgi:hypothetical protein
MPDPVHHRKKRAKFLQSKFKLRRGLRKTPDPKGPREAPPYVEGTPVKPGPVTAQMLGALIRFEPNWVANNRSLMRRTLFHPAISLVAARP